MSDIDSSPNAPLAPEPFTLTDIGLNDAEISGLKDFPIATPEAAPVPPVLGDELELTPFSFEDLGLSPEEIAALEGEPAPTKATPQASDESELTPFSLEDLGLSAEEIAQFEAPTPLAPLAASSTTNTIQQIESLSSLEPFDWTSADAEAVTSEFDEENELSNELTPFSLDDLDLSASGAVDLSENLPPSLQPFSIDDMAPPLARPPTPSSLPPSINDNSDRAGYSWQSPTRKSTGFLRDKDATPLDSGPSIFAKLKQRHEELPPAEPASPFSNDNDDTASGFFSDDNISLRDEQAVSTTNKFASGFRLPKEHELAADSSQPEVSPPVPFESDEPELMPFSLEDLGLSPEEIAMLGGESVPTPTAVAPAQPAPVVNDEPELTPFSLEDLGLSPEEIAMLGGESVPTPAASTTQTEFVDDMMGDLGEPFSFDEYIDSAETASASRDNDSFDGDDVKPFSFDDLDSDLSGDGNSMNRELGLTTDELADFSLGELLDARAKATSNYDGDSTPVDTGDPTLDRLVTLGQRHGYVDITDIIAEVKDPEAEAERIEEIGWILHRAGIQIRDGDEIIDMEASEGEVVEEEIFEMAEPPPRLPIPAPVVSDEPELTPFSFEDLGLSPEEIAALGLDTSSIAAVAPEAQPEPPAPVASDEPELTPFSLEDLGLSPEEIAALSGTASTLETDPAPLTSDDSELLPFSLEELGLSAEEIAALSPEIESVNVEPALDSRITTEDLDGDFDFGVVDSAPVEQVAKAKRTAPRVIEAEPTVAAEDIGFAAEPLDALDDIWDAPQLPSPEPEVRPSIRPEPSTKAEPPARVVLPPRKERSAPVERPARERPARERSAPVERSRNTPTRAGWGRGRDNAQSAGFGSAGGSNLPKADIMPRSFIPTGDETLDAYLIQLENEPQNLPLHLAIARISAQTGRVELMAAVYHKLIKTGQALSQIVDEVEDLIAGAADTGTERQLYRTLGDAYSRQGHLREAVAAYSHTVQ